MTKALPFTQATIRRAVEACLVEPIKPGSKTVMRDCPYQIVDATHVLMLRDRKKGLPGAANNRRKYLSSLFGWAIERKVYKLGSNPCRDVKTIRYASSGFHTWTVEDVHKYVERHPVGTAAYLAFALMLFLGARRQDAAALGPRNIRDGMMVYIPRKTDYRRTDEAIKPILPPLAEAIRRSPIGIKTFIVTGQGRPFSAAGFGNKMRQWCDEAGLPDCTAHGLKKIAATICAELGASDRQMMALFDWSSERMVKVYTGNARNRLLAAEASKLLGSFSWDKIENKSDAV